MSVVLIVPARLASTRLPRKVLADIGGKPMIQHVLEKALAADLGPVVLACDHEDVAIIGRRLSVPTFITDSNLPSGSDRLYQALQQYDPQGCYEKILNVQGDLPTIDPTLIHHVLAPLEQEVTDISTLACRIQDPREHENPNVVKAVLAAPHEVTTPIRRALYFSRAAVPTGEGPRYHHIGLYGYRRPALETFIQLPPSPLEKQEKLEQLRALEAGLRLDAYVVETIPLGVDSQDDLDKARIQVAHSASS